MTFLLALILGELCLAPCFAGGGEEGSMFFIIIHNYGISKFHMWQRKIS